MRNKLMILCVALFAIAVVGCTKEHKSLGGGGGTTGEDMVNEWTVKMLEANYLWNINVRAKTKNYKLDYIPFFKSLLTTTEEDGRHNANESSFYSYIEKVEANTYASAGTFETSMGLDFYLDYKVRTDNAYGGIDVAAVVTYVQPGSPAEGAKIKRGDYIWDVNGVGYYTSEIFYRPLYGASGVAKITWSRPTLNGSVVTQQYHYDVALTPTSMEQDPIVIAEVIPSESGVKVGYLLYNKFERGGDSRKYDNKLKDVLRGFKAEGIKKLVIDLRYNPGGYVSSCQLLASMIVPANMAGKDFMRLTYNDELRAKYGDKEYNAWLKVLTLDQMKNTNYGTTAGVQLDLTDVYVIATGASASASESLIHCLRGLGVTVYHVGTKTAGKNVGMTLYRSVDAGKAFSFDGNKYEMWPVTFYIKDAKDQKYTSNGFAPGVPDGYAISEYDDSILGNLGDVNDTYLKTVLFHIDNGYFPLSKRSVSYAENKEVLERVHDPRNRVGMKVTADILD